MQNNNIIQPQFQQQIFFPSASIRQLPHTENFDKGVVNNYRTNFNQINTASLNTNLARNISFENTNFNQINNTNYNQANISFVNQSIEQQRFNQNTFPSYNNRGLNYF